MENKIDTDLDNKKKLNYIELAKTLTLDQYRKVIISDIKELFEDQLVINTQIKLNNMQEGYFSMRFTTYFIYNNNLGDKTVDEIITLYKLMKENR